MSTTPLDTNFKDDILASSNAKRKYQMTYNDDGTVSFQDVTAYSQMGSAFGAKEVNEERAAINKINSDRIVTLDEIDLVTEPGFFVDAMAVKELNRKLENITEYDPISGIGINYFSAIEKYNSVCVSGNIWIASGSGWKTIANLPTPVAVTRFPVGYGTAVTSGQITASGELQINLKGGTNTAYEFAVCYFSK